MTNHVSGSIEELLKKDDAEIEKLFAAPAQTIRTELKAKAESGVKFVRATECDNFDPLQGCLGHGEGVKEKHWLKSSNLSLARYDPQALKLTVKFLNGNVYEYSDVPQQVWADFINAESGGSFLAKNIVKKFQSLKIT